MTSRGKRPASSLCDGEVEELAEGTHDEQAFDLGEHGMVSASCCPRKGSSALPIGATIRLPNTLWSGWATGTSICRVEGYVASLPQNKRRKGPAYVVRTLEDGHCYPFPPKALAEAAMEGNELWRKERAAASAQASASDTANGGASSAATLGPASEIRSGAVVRGDAVGEETTLEAIEAPAGAPESDDEVLEADTEEADAAVTAIEEWLPDGLT